MVLHPVGPQPAAVYWLRRAVLLLVLLGVVLLLVRACAAVVDDEGESVQTAVVPTAPAEPSPGVATSGRATPGRATSEAATSGAATPGAATPGAATPGAATPMEPTPTPPTPSSSAGLPPPAGAQPCRELQVSVAADDDAYGPQRTPRFTLTVTNPGERPCVRDVGPRTLEAVLTSGGVPVWNSGDCASERRRLVTIGSGASYEREVVWSRLRTAQGCAAPPTADPGTYVVTARAGEVGGGRDVLVLE